MDDTRTLSREVEATLIPQGTPMSLPEGETITITHRLGGNFTVMTHNGMFRIKGADADALGETVSEVSTTDDEHEGPPEQDALWEALRKVFDPEIPVNIVDLGLVYSLDSKERPEGGYKIDMDMTLTAPGCGMGPAIAEDAKGQLERVPGVSEAEVNIVWDPPWNQDMITEEGKMVLGLV
ncbi:MAG: putative Fe-S cluster assembly protein SufT [Puniceicoccaceae bacterium]|nr:MAG: putative Fe-S cluster assembly protein SufT [Puniceicoccaceae bacterium]